MAFATQSYIHQSDYDNLQCLLLGMEQYVRSEESCYYFALVLPGVHATYVTGCIDLLNSGMSALCMET